MQRRDVEDADDRSLVWLGQIGPEAGIDHSCNTACMQNRREQRTEEGSQSAPPTYHFDTRVAGVVPGAMGITLAITCEAHIDDAKGIAGHLQLQRFDRFIALFDVAVAPAVASIQ